MLYTLTLLVLTLMSQPRSQPWHPAPPQTCVIVQEGNVARERCHAGSSINPALKAKMARLTDR